jgi:Leucine-rich repeat (LRR) protein
MGLSVSLFLFLLSQLHLLFILSSPSMQVPLCHHDDSSALLQFKESFIINKFASFYFLPTCDQKVASWTVEGDKSDCCSWDGVECDEDTGHVIGLNLSNSCLFGSINSNSSLFRLVHLQSLNLSNNDFNGSHIPSQVRDLSRLIDLDLHSSHFVGQIPLEISQLSHLSSLDLSSSFRLSYYINDLKLKKPSLRSLVGNLTGLQTLDLSEVDIGSTVPNILTNLSSLKSLSLGDCGLHGEFPVSIFKLSNLRFLSVSENNGLTGYFPDFTWSSLLETLDVGYTSFSGELPASMGNLGFLTKMITSGCDFSGYIPSSLGNLTKLTYLDLSVNAFVGNVPPSIGNLLQLSFLDISKNQLTGPVPSELLNLPQLWGIYLSDNLLSGEMHFELLNETQLIALELSNNRLTGSITFVPMNLTQLGFLDLSANEFHGQVSNSLFNFKNLVVLDLSENYLNGIVEFDEFVKLNYLTILDISGNELLLVTTETDANATRQNFVALGFSSCNLSEFPNFLRNQDHLEYLNMSNNKLDSWTSPRMDVEHKPCQSRIS